jgi:hypothetical protein
VCVCVCVDLVSKGVRRKKEVLSTTAC